jgi:hypothetical protein
MGGGQNGMGFGVFPELRITPLIPAERVTPKYMLRLRRDSALSERILDYLLYGIPQRRMGLALLARVIVSGLRGGLWELRLRWAGARRESAAAKFIQANRLCTMDSLPIACVAAADATVGLSSGNGQSITFR